jgi:cysteinyl-tRNA synthetase
VTVRLYDTQVQALRDFAPQDPANVTMYVCGPTVQSGPGIHHLRAALAFDLLRRWLSAATGASRSCATSPTSTTRCCRTRR